MWSLPIWSVTCNAHCSPVFHMSHPSHPDKVNEVFLPFFIATSQIPTQYFKTDTKPCSSCEFSLTNTAARTIKTQKLPNMYCVSMVTVNLRTNFRDSWFFRNSRNTESYENFGIGPMLLISIP